MPWYYTYILGRTRAVVAAHRACYEAGVPPPDPCTVNIFDAAAVRAYITHTASDNAAFETEQAAMLARAQPLSR